MTSAAPESLLAVASPIHSIASAIQKRTALAQPSVVRTFLPVISTCIVLLLVNQIIELWKTIHIYTFLSTSDSDLKKGKGSATPVVVGRPLFSTSLGRCAHEDMLTRASLVEISQSSTTGQ